MRSLTFVHRKTQGDVKLRLNWRRALERAQVVGAVVGLFGGVGSSMFGSVFTAAGWLVANEGARRWLSTSGAVLLLLTIPLLIIGGVCMDWAEKNRPGRNYKAVRYEYDDDEDGGL